MEPTGDDISTRERLKRAILQGRVDDVIDDVYNFYPDIAARLESIVFRLRCHKFVEMVKSSSIKASALDAALAYGRSLQEMYGDDADEEEIRETLMETFSLLAYAAPERQGGRVAYLVSQEAREELADELNSAILGASTAPGECELPRSMTLTWVGMLGRGAREVCAAGARSFVPTRGDDARTAGPAWVRLSGARAARRRDWVTLFSCSANSCLCAYLYNVYHCDLDTSWRREEARGTAEAFLLISLSPSAAGCSPSSATPKRLVLPNNSQRGAA
jgi:hypothetical protein